MSGWGSRAAAVGLAMAAGVAWAEPVAESTVGMPVELRDVVIGGPLLEPVPLEAGSREPVVLRVEAAYPHGDAHRYDFVVYALEPGVHDLRDSLQRADGEALDRAALSPLELVVGSVLPAGQVVPNPLVQPRAPWLGGYRWALVLAGVLWAAGLLALVLWRRGRPGVDGGEVGGVAPPTLAERLRAAAEKARRGELTTAGQAELERLLLGFWRRRLGLEDLGAAEAVARLRQHPEAGALLDALERWLHAPPAAGGAGGAAVPEAELAGLLAPYEHIADDDGGDPAAGKGGGR